MMQQGMTLIIVTGLLIVAAALLSLPSVHIPDGLDKIVHALVIGALMMLLIKLHRHYRRTYLPVIVMGWLMMTLAVTGGLYEEWQSRYVPTRKGDPFDWVADFAGIGLGLGYYILDVRRHRV